MRSVPDQDASWLLVCGRVVTPDGVLSPGWIRVTGTRIDAIGPGQAAPSQAAPSQAAPSQAAPSQAALSRVAPSQAAPGQAAPSQVPPGQEAGPQVIDLNGHWILPGFVDIHVHGGGGASFTEGTSDDARNAAEFHRRHGSTTLLASLVTAPLAELQERAALLAALADEEVIAGLHLEGPFLSPARRGAQDPRHMLAPDVAAFERLRAAARGHLRVLTLAPELPGAIPLVQTAARAGVTVAIGHTDATAEETSAAIDAGATHATHLFNGMRPPHHREPGAAGALLDRDEVTCEVIADGVHLHDMTIRLAARAAGPGRLVLITDATAAAGMPDGSYRLGSMRVTVVGGVARLAGGPGPSDVTGGVARLADEPGPSDVTGGVARPADGPGPSGVPARAGHAGDAVPAGPIAGSTATMASVVRHALAAGLAVTEVAAAASTTPARVLGIGDRTGALRPGLAADLVVCDDDFRLRAVMRRGRWLAEPAGSEAISPAGAPSR
jgi:N-acetylglucosamine-6-phosphate deacetylase